MCPQGAAWRGAGQIAAHAAGAAARAAPRAHWCAAARALCCLRPTIPHREDDMTIEIRYCGQ
jgi:hypothetical protein